MSASRTFVRLLVASLCGLGGAHAGHAAEPGSLAEFNAWAHDFNRGFSVLIVKPVLDGARALPDPLPTALANVFGNLTEPVSVLSHAMVGDGWSAANATARFAVNTTAGLGGMIDVASAMGLPPNKRHFSEGICAWNIPMTDRFLVVPAIGASSVGIAGSAIVFMAGSTVALGLISIELAIASTLADVVGSAAALESVANAADGAGDLTAEEAAFRDYLRHLGCAAPETGPARAGQGLTESGTPTAPM